MALVVRALSSLSALHELISHKSPKFSKYTQNKMTSNALVAISVVLDEVNLFLGWLGPEHLFSEIFLFGVDDL